MYHFVPDFDTDIDYVNTNNNPNSSSPLIHPRKSILDEDEDDNLMELLWEKGQVVVQNQRHNNTSKKPPSPPKLQAPIPQQQQQQSDHSLFIQEDEMTSWLHYHPLQNDDFCSDLLFESNAPPPTPSVTKTVETTTTQVAAPKPPVRNFTNFSRLRGDFIGRGATESGPKAIVRESTHVNPSAVATPSASESALTRRTDSSVVDGGNMYNRKGKAVMETAPGIEILGASSKSEIEQEKANVVDERKRKERDVTADETECCSEETKQVRGGGGGSSSSNKRTRAAEVHNLSERKRRDRINERMKALQELIPRCNKSDKASMLDEAIEYMKSLQLQVQMMSMGCGMIPMMYQPGMQQYMAMGMGMNQPLPPPSFMPFPNMLPAVQRPLPTTQTHMGSGSGPPYPPPPPPVHASGPSRIFVPNQQYDPTAIPPPQCPGYMDPYQQFCGLHPTQPPQFQNQATSIQSSRRVSSSKESEVQGNNTTG